VGSGNDRPSRHLPTSEDEELRQLMKGVAEAGSWTRCGWASSRKAGWMKLFVAGGLTFKRARMVTGKISAVITECRCAVTKVRHERAAKEGAEAAKRRQKNNWKRRCMRWTMSAMGDRWAAVGNNRLSNSCGEWCCTSTMLCAQAQAGGG
jgi:hypothetical protein